MEERRGLKPNQVIGILFIVVVGGLTIWLIGEGNKSTAEAKAASAKTTIQDPKLEQAAKDVSRLFLIAHSKAPDSLSNIKNQIAQYASDTTGDEYILVSTVHYYGRDSTKTHYMQQKLNRQLELVESWGQ